MLTQYTPLTLPLIEEGQLMADLEAAFASLQAQLVAFREVYGDNARGAKATLALKIVLVSSTNKDDPHTFGVKSTLHTSAPNRPATITIAQGDVNPDTGQPALFVRLEGSTEDPPRQAHLPLVEGQPVTEPAAGE